MNNVLNNYNSFWKMCKRILSLSLPMAGTQFINVASGFLCMTMLAQLGHEVLAASALIFSAQLSIMVSGMSILFSLSVLVSHAYGLQDYKTIGNYVQQAWVLGILVGIPIIILFWHMHSILIYFDQQPAIANIVRDYFHAFIWAVIPGFLSTCNQQFGYAIHKQLMIIFASIISVAILLIFSYGLIFGKFGLPALGVAGLGYAQVAQYSFFLIFTTLFFFFEKNFHKFELFKYHAHQHLEHFIEMLKIGWPISIQMGGEMLSFFVNSIMIGWLGITALSAFQIVNQYYFLIVIPIFSLSQATGILIGQARGAKQYHEIKKLSYASMTAVIFVSLCVMILFLLFPAYLAAFYIDIHNSANFGTLNLVMAFFAVIAFSQLFDSIRNVLIGILRGMFDTRYPMFMSLVTIWIIGMPTSYFLAFTLHAGAIGFVFGGLIGMLSGVLVMAYRWLKLIKQY